MGTLASCNATYLSSGTWATHDHAAEARGAGDRVRARKPRIHHSTEPCDSDPSHTIGSWCVAHENAAREMMERTRAAGAVS